MRTKAALFLLAGLIGFTIIFSARVKAEDSTSSSTEPTGTPRTFFSFFGNRSPEPSESPKDSESPEPSETPRVKGIDRLEGQRLNFCQDHEDEIDTRLGSLGGLVANMLGKFDAIATRVENFYTSKVEPTHPISNYAALVADIASKRAAAVTALTSAQNDINGFTCTSTNPKGELKLFRTDMQTVKKALHDYRTSIKNLIVAVATAIGETEGTPGPSESPEALSTATPVPTSTP